MTRAAQGALLRAATSGMWWFDELPWPHVLAGITDRQTDAARLTNSLPADAQVVWAQQVHGASIAVINCVPDATVTVPGCDALLTRRRGVALAIRTADCLPIFVLDPIRRAVGLAHVGWRGLVGQLPMRLVAAFGHAFQSRSDDLRVAIGPAIRACCYEVGPEVAERFKPFLRPRGDRYTCDLVGATIAQLCDSGVDPDQVIDCGRCTACEPERWFSLRRDGPAADRMTSFIMLRGSSR